MSFLSHFRQPAPVHKPWMCNSCRRRFKIKAHAANHQRQSCSVSCRSMGFSFVSSQAMESDNKESIVDDLVENNEVAGDNTGAQDSDAHQLGNSDCELDMESYTDDESNLAQEEHAIFPFGDDVDEMEQDVKKDNLSRKGSMKATPYKIDRCIRRMEDLSTTDESLSQRAIAVQVAREYSTHWRNCYRWKYEWSAAKQAQVRKSAEQHLIGTLLPSQLKSMSIGHVRRADIAEIIDSEFVKRKKAGKKVDFNWFRSRFNYWYHKENETPPSDSTVARFLKRSHITMQRVRDHKSKTVEERLEIIKDWYLRLDALQRKRAVGGRKRISDEDTYCFDEFSIVIKPKTATSYNRKGAEANQVKEHMDLASRAASGLVTFRYGGEPVGKMHVIFPLAPKKLWGFDEKGEKVLSG